MDVWLAGGAPPPRSEASELLRPRAEELIQQLVVEGRNNENLATPSPQRALQAYEDKYGEDAVTAAFGDKTTYLASCDLPVAVKGTSKRFWWLGDGTPRGDRYFDPRSEDAKEILAAAQPSGAAALAAPGGTTGAEGVTRPPWEGLELVASSSAKRDEELNHWEEWFKKDEKPYQTLWNGGAWPADEEPKEWDDFGSPYGAPPAIRRPSQVAGYYRGPLLDGVSYQGHMWKNACRATRRWRRTGSTRSTTRKCARATMPSSRPTGRCARSGGPRAVADLGAAARGSPTAPRMTTRR